MNDKTLTILVSFMSLCAVAVRGEEVDFGEPNKVYMGNVGGYAHVGKEAVDDAAGSAGYSMYTAAWPLQPEHPGRSFQSGLYGTWMFPVDAKGYSDIEGGLGWWRNTAYPTPTPKFIMGGVELKFRGWANGPGAGKGRNWDNPRGLYGVAQLSPWVLFPPDGLNLKQGTCGELFGYGYQPLPLTDPKSTTAGADVPTGNQCWTLFLGTGNFKGPLAFFTPYFWSRVTVGQPGLAGAFLDNRPSKANRQISMETQHIRCAQVMDDQGELYVRMAPTQFPVGRNGKSIILHRLCVYNKAALWDGVKAWFEGGDPVSGAFAPEGTCVQKFTGKGSFGWKAFMRHMKVEKNQRPSFAMDFVKPVADETTFGFEWDYGAVAKKRTKNGYLVTLPELYRYAETGKPGKRKLVPADSMPAASKKRGQKRGQAAYFVILIDEHICLCMSGSHGKKTSS